MSNPDMSAGIVVDCTTFESRRNAGRYLAQMIRTDDAYTAEMGYGRFAAAKYTEPFPTKTGAPLEHVIAGMLKIASSVHDNMTGVRVQSKPKALIMTVFEPSRAVKHF